LTFGTIRLTGYGFIAEKPRVGHLPPIFPCTLWEKLCVGSIGTFLVVSTSSYHRAKFGEIELRAPAVGAKMSCLFFLFITLRVRRVVHSSGIYFEELLCRYLWVDFHSVFVLFSEVIALSYKR